MKFISKAKVTGYIDIVVDAKNEAAAAEKTEAVINSAKFGDLCNIEYKIDPPTNFDQRVKGNRPVDREPGQMTSGKLTYRVDEIVREMIESARKTWEIGDQLCDLLGIEDDSELFEILTEIQECSATDPEEVSQRILEIVDL